jgi:L-iditol 2-dehydrogenase
MSCHYCNRGSYTQCDHWTETGIDPGGFAEFFRVPAENVRIDTHLLNDSIPPEAGVIIEPMACTLRGLWQTKIHPGDTAVIIGAGFMGLCFLQLAKLWPFSTVIVLDLNSWRLQLARDLGADLALNPSEQDVVKTIYDINEGRGADSVFVTASSMQAYEMGLSICDKGGTLHLNAPTSKKEIWSVNAFDLFFREITINSAYSADHRATRAIIDLLASGRVSAEPLITHRFGLHQLEQAVQLVLDAGDSLKPVIIPSLTKRS